ncbi:hypothetical protein RADP37_05332 [Roseomonas mucosa]|uniref:Uncharacterized protein n=1 Tax=Roseomonas mucosa TaxID=207340 RepID=A0A4Y1N0U7_9PROT|nr:hypothetical protein RADP37_05332 [Roseomonas mucosa]
MSPKYPNITVQLTGRDSNAFMILASCRRAAKEAGLSQQEIDAFYQEATSGDHDHLIQTAMRWFSCE